MATPSGQRLESQKRLEMLRSSRGNPAFSRLYECFYKNLKLYLLFSKIICIFALLN
jgi:hypothetical protein